MGKVEQSNLCVANYIGNVIQFAPHNDYNIQSIQIWTITRQVVLGTVKKPTFFRVPKSS